MLKGELYELLILYKLMYTITNNISKFHFKRWSRFWDISENLQGKIVRFTFLCHSTAVFFLHYNHIASKWHVSQNAVCIMKRCCRLLNQNFVFLSLFSSMTNWAKLFTDFLFYAHNVRMCPDPLRARSLYLRKGHFFIKCLGGHFLNGKKRPPWKKLLLFLKEILAIVLFKAESHDIRLLPQSVSYRTRCVEFPEGHGRDG